MKLLKPVSIIIAIFWGLTTSAQNSCHLKLSKPAPKPSETVRFTYDPDGTGLDRKQIQATIYFLDNDRFPVADAALIADGKRLKGKFTIPANATAFCVKLNDGEHADNNNGKGYLYQVYKNDRPVQGAYASIAYAIGLGSDLFGIKKNMEASASYYKREFNLHPDLEKDDEDLYLLTLFYSNAADQQLACNRAKVLAQSGKEENMIGALNYYKHSKRLIQADSLLSVIKQQFPSGKETEIELAATFDNEQDIRKKDSLYYVLMAKYSINAKAIATELDYKRIQLTMAHLRQDDLDGFNKWEKQVKNKSGLANGIYNITSAWAKNGEHLDDAENVTRQTLALLDSLYKSGTSRMYLSPKQTKADNRETYNECADTYALVLYKEHKYKEALRCEQAVYHNEKIQDTAIDTHYVMILNANGRYKGALNVIKKSFAAGVSSPALKEELKKTYTKINGSDQGFASYLNVLDQSAGKERLMEMAKTMIDTPAASFDLRDISGHHVSLASLKGKVVVIDFWANWCAPCKESFPGMQLAINKYKNDPNIQFVFIDTWENGSNYITETKKYMAANNYNFEVLFDGQAADGSLSKIRAAYDVNSLPTKVVIDANGHIRFKTSGYPGSPQAVADEITSMIELAKNL